MIKFYDTPEDFKNNKLMCNAWVATAIIGSAVIGGAATVYGAGQAADAQRDAAQMSVDAQGRQYNQTRADLLPYQNLGMEAGDKLKAANYYTDPINLTQDWLEKTPGYQFTKTQGLKSVQNSAASRGLGNSGAALKGAASFVTGLADNTYKTQFDVANTNQTNAYNRLKGLVDTGENAAARTGVVGANAANKTSDAVIGAGNATAAQYNATGGAVANVANNVGGYYAYKGLYGGGGQRQLTPGEDALT